MNSLSESSGLGGTICSGISRSLYGQIGLWCNMSIRSAPTVVGEFAFQVVGRLECVQHLEVVRCHVEVAKCEILERNVEPARRSINGNRLTVMVARVASTLGPAVYARLGQCSDSAPLRVASCLRIRVLPSKLECSFEPFQFCNMQGLDRRLELDDRRCVAFLLQPDYTTALHDLLLKSTSNDTAQIKSVRFTKIIQP